MSIERTVQDIKKLYTAISGKGDNEVVMTYKGTGYGVQKPWHVRIDNREINAANYAAAVETLRDMLKVELQKKAEDMEHVAQSLHQTLNTMKD
jgi:DNA-binding winged helix-turn-helix (wHTH) protein